MSVSFDIKLPVCFCWFWTLFSLEILEIILNLPFSVTNLPFIKDKWRKIWWLSHSLNLTGVQICQLQFCRRLLYMVLGCLGIIIFYRWFLHHIILSYYINLFIFFASSERQKAFLAVLSLFFSKLMGLP